MGFYGKLPDCTCLDAEVWEIYRGLKVIVDRGIGNVEIKTDSEMAVQLVKESTSPHSPHKNVVALWLEVEVLSGMLFMKAIE